LQDGQQRRQHGEGADDGAGVVAAVAALSVTGVYGVPVGVCPRKRFPFRAISRRSFRSQAWNQMTG
jgi:hypothetical protein